MLVLRCLTIANSGVWSEIWVLEMWFEYSESGISGILVLNILKKEAIVKHVSTQVFNLKFECLKCDLSTQNLEFLGFWFSIFWKKEAIVKHVSTQVFDNCKILIWNLSAWNVIWVLRIWNFWDFGSQYFEKRGNCETC